MKSARPTSLIDDGEQVDNRSLRAPTTSDSGNEAATDCRARGNRASAFGATGGGRSRSDYGNTASGESTRAGEAEFDFHDDRGNNGGGRDGDGPLRL